MGDTNYVEVFVIPLVHFNNINSKYDRIILIIVFKWCTNYFNILISNPTLKMVGAQSILFLNAVIVQETTHMAFTMLIFNRDKILNIHQQYSDVSNSISDANSDPLL